RPVLARASLAAHDLFEQRAPRPAVEFAEQQVNQPFIRRLAIVSHHIKRTNSSRPPRAARARPRPRQARTTREVSRPSGTETSSQNRRSTRRPPLSLGTSSPPGV